MIPARTGRVSCDFSRRLRFQAVRSSRLRDGQRPPAEDASSPLLISSVPRLRRRSYAVDDHEKRLETPRQGRPGARATDRAGTARTEAVDRARPTLLGSVGQPVATSLASRPRSPHPSPTPRIPASAAASRPSARPPPSSDFSEAKTWNFSPANSASPPPPSRRVPR
jgi:hypothetical protein